MSDEASFTDVKVYWDETPMVERIEDAISEACNHALPPFLLERCARAAIETVRLALIDEADKCKSMTDSYGLFCAVETLEDALFTQNTPVASHSAG